jgi:hypothetical protein
MNDTQKLKLLLICDAVIEAVKVAGDRGAPGGVIYSALMAQGCTFSQYQSLMAALVATGKLRQSGQLYFVAEAAR